MTRPSPQLLKNCLMTIQKAKFKPDTSLKSQFIFPTEITQFSIKSPNKSNANSLWSIIGPGKSKLLKIIAGEYIAHPPLSRIYYDNSKIKFLNFRENSGLDKVHMSARYEAYSYKGVLEMSDDTNSVFNYITGLNNYNTMHKQEDISREFVDQLLKLFNLDHLQKKWIQSLSNGQLRRARLVKALMDRPNILLIDDPFLGLDPKNTTTVSEALYRVAKELNISIVLGLRVQDDIPDWINSIAYVDNEFGVKVCGLKEEVFDDYQKEIKLIQQEHLQHESIHHQHTKLVPITQEEEQYQSPIHIEFNNASIIYKGLIIFQNFNWKIPKGSKWRILGDNGTGKTTLLSIITGDHPQSWRSVISIDGKLRKTGNGISIFDVNNKIGISSPELHSLVPQHTRTMNEIIYNGLVKDIGNSNFMYKRNPKNHPIPPKSQAILDQFKQQLDQYGDELFINLSMTNQKLCLFLRAIIKQPEILILDEAFSCMEDEKVMIQCHKIIEHQLNDMTVLTIGHLDWEIPNCQYLLQLTGDNDRSYRVYKYA